MIDLSDTKNRKEEDVGLILARLRSRKGISRDELADLCSVDFGEEVYKVKSYICRVEQGRKKLIKPEDRKRVKIMLKKLGATVDDVLNIIKYPSADEMIELGLLFEPAAITSRMDEIVLRVVELKHLLRRYGLEPQVTSTPPELCSTSLDLESELSNLKRCCQRDNDTGPGDILHLIQDFRSTRIPITDLVGNKLRTLAHNKRALAECIEDYLSGMRKATKNVGEVGAGFLDSLTRVDEIVLSDYSVAWLSILEQAQLRKARPFPLLVILEGRGRILSWEDGYQWEMVSKTRGWEYEVIPLDRRNIEGYFTHFGKHGRRFVLAVGAEAVDLHGNVLTSQGLRLISQKAKDHPSGTVAVATQSFKVHDFGVESYLWGTDQYRQPFTLDIIPAASYSVIITDDASHWSKQLKSLDCCVKKWTSYLKGGRLGSGTVWGTLGGYS